MKHIIETEPLNRWIVWTEWDACGRRLSGRTFQDEAEAKEYEKETGGQLEFVGEVYTA